jgi:preprotein translocase subunit Sss1
MIMKQDKAILKALKSEESPSLPSDFNARMMSRVYLAAEKKKKRAYVLSLCLISAVSLCLIGMAGFLMRDYLMVDFTFRMPHITFGSLSKYGFSIYIAALTFVLIGLDNHFRNVWLKRKNNKSGQLNER